MSVQDALTQIAEDESWQGVFDDQQRHILIQVAEQYLWSMYWLSYDSEIEAQRMCQMLRAGKLNG